MAVLVPRLGVNDLERELRFFSALGFEIHERTATDALLRYERVTLSLRAFEAWRVSDRALLDWDRAPAQFGTGVHLYVEIDDVDDLARRIPVGVPRPWPVQDKPTGFRELTLRTPTGYLVTFAHPLPGR